MDWHPQTESNVIRTHQIHAVSHHVMHHVDAHSMHSHHCIGMHRIVVSIAPTTLQKLVEASGVKTVVRPARLIGLKGRVGRSPCRSLSCRLATRAPWRLWLVTTTWPCTLPISVSVLPVTLPITTPRPSRFADCLPYTPSSRQFVSEAQTRRRRPYSTRNRPSADCRTSCPGGHRAR